ncbi:MAG: outer membrane lipoprotein-sorting protein [Pseudomonadota bacterium]
MLKPAIAALGLILCSASASAMTAQERGLEIALEAERRDAGFSDSVATLTMVLTSARGETGQRQLVIKTLEAPEPGEGDWSLVVFHQPADVKGTALLTYARILEPDDQWIFLPAMKRVKRIASVNKSGPFMGSEFAYEDMVAPEPGKYEHLYLRDEPCGGLICHVVERRPKYEDSGYSKLIVWLDRQELRTQKIAYYDRQGAHVKTLTLKSYRQYGGRWWRAHDMEMVNHQTGKATRLMWSAYRLAAGLGQADFSRASLARQ